MHLYESNRYEKEIAMVAKLPYQWEKLSDKSVAVSGGTGMIGSFLIDVLLYRNKHYEQNTKIYVIGRNETKAWERFGEESFGKGLCFIPHDISLPFSDEECKVEQMDYIIHAASNTHPVAYASDPVGTISANVMGTDHLLSWAKGKKCQRFLFLSSVEIYGENRGDTDQFGEEYLGYIDCNTLRAGYPESKRTGEALCQAYIRQEGLDVVIPRLSRVYGPTVLKSDTKAISQFISKGVNRENIVLKSEGTQEYSYCYVGDAASALFLLLLEGKCGEAYNVASEQSDIALKNLAGIIADYAGTKVSFELPDEVEAAGYSKATKATLDIGKLKSLGWKSLCTMEQGLQNTINILREVWA